jgi:hypothetical protein
MQNKNSSMIAAGAEHAAGYVQRTTVTAIQAHQR